MDVKRCATWSFVISVAAIITGAVFDGINANELFKNQETLAKNETASCDEGIKYYPWAYLLTYIAKLFCYALYVIFTGRALCNDYSAISDGMSCNEMTSLISCVLATICQFVDLLVLTIFSFACFQLEGTNVFHDMVDDALFDFLSGLFGTFGLVAILFVVRNSVPVLFTVVVSCCKKNTSGNVTVSFCTRVCTLVLFLFGTACIILAIILMSNFIKVKKCCA